MAFGIRKLRPANQRRGTLISQFSIKLHTLIDPVESLVCQTSQTPEPSGSASRATKTTNDAARLSAPEAVTKQGTGTRPSNLDS